MSRKVQPENRLTREDWTARGLPETNSRRRRRVSGIGGDSQQAEQTATIAQAAKVGSKWREVSADVLMVDGPSDGV